MDAIDRALYEGVEVDEELYQAYHAVFNESKESQIVLSDLLRTCNYGSYKPDSDSKLRIFERSTVILRIKSILNGVPVEATPEEENDE